MNKTEMIRTVALFLIFTYFLIGASLFLDKLELNNDEATIGMAALCLITPEAPTYRSRLMHGGCAISSEHKGAVASFPAALVLLLFGKSVFNFRFVQVLFSLGSLACIYYVCSRHLGRMAGMFTVFLLAVNSTFIRVTRIGNMKDEVIQIFLFWLGLALIQLFLERKKRFFLSTAAFIFGVALWQKLMFLGYLLGFLAAFLVFGRKSYQFLKTRIFKARRDIAVFAAAFAAGCAPLLVYNICHRWPTIADIFGSFDGPSARAHAEGWNNLNFLHNLALRFHGLNKMLGGNNVPDAMFSRGNAFNLLFFYIALGAVLLYLFLGKKNPIAKNKVWFLLISYSALLLLSAFIPDSGAFDPSHVIILLPAIQIVQAIFLSLVIIYAARRAWAYLIIASMLLPYSYSEFVIIKNILLFQKNGKIVSLSFTRRLVGYLEKQNIKEVFCFDNRLLASIDFLSELRIITWGFNVSENDFWGHPLYATGVPGHMKITVESVYEYQLKGMNPFYMIRNRYNDFSESGFQRLKKLIERDHKQLTLMEVFTNEVKNLYLEIYRVQDHAGAGL
ncbi:MAG: glycosyltransferase family 39 protein [Candidatus Omnitrophica bacterium]|nr:glycosyltransferase family 39 protein [Candidatus Omnitrophota bacterium]